VEAGGSPGTPRPGLRIGVLGLQGDFREHLAVLVRLGVDTLDVRTPEQLAGIDGLVIPGGESTTMGKLADRFGLIEPLRERIGAGMPVYGTCAGMIFLAARITDGDQPRLGTLDVTVRRNAFGRQVDSFEADLEIRGMSGGSFHAVFIRAPWIEQVGIGVEVLAEVDGRIVAVRQGGVLATSFHPELGEDTRFHRMFLEMVEEAANRSAREGRTVIVAQGAQAGVKPGHSAPVAAEPRR